MNGFESYHASIFYRAFFTYRHEVGPVFENDIDKIIDVLYQNELTANIIKELFDLKQANDEQYEELKNQIRSINGKQNTPPKTHSKSSY